MANNLYPLWKQALLNGEADVDLDSANLYLLLCDATYSYSADDAFLDDVVGIVADSRTADAALGSVTVDVAALFDADDQAVSNVAGAQIVSLVLYRWTGASATSRLIMFQDTIGSGFPLTPNGGSVNIVWDAQGIFQLGGA